MRSHTSISLRQAKSEFTWLVRQVEQHRRTFVVTKDGAPAVAVVPCQVLAGLDAKSAKRGRKIAALLRKLEKLMPGAAVVRARAR